MGGGDQRAWGPLGWTNGGKVLRAGELPQELPQELPHDPQAGEIPVVPRTCSQLATAHRLPVLCRGLDSQLV